MNAMKLLLFLLLAGMKVKSSEYEWTEAESESEWNEIKNARKVVQKTTKRLDNAQRKYRSNFYFFKKVETWPISFEKISSINRLRCRALNLN